MKVIRLVVLAMACSVLYVGNGSAEAAVVAGGHQVGAATHVSTAYDGARKKKKHHKKKHHKKKKKAKKTVAKRSCPAPALGVTRTTGTLTYSWANAACGKRYRVLLSSSAYGNVPNLLRSTGWVNPVTTDPFHVPTPHAGDGMLGVAYGNPVYSRLQAVSTWKDLIRVSPWHTIWPVAPAPAAGDPVRMGSYNIEMTTPNSHVGQIAQNISSHGVTVASLQEASDLTASRLVAALGGGWRVSPHSPRTTQQVIYRSDLFDVKASGTYQVSNPRDPSTPLVNPWVRLRAHHPVSSASQSFYVTTLHITENTAHSATQDYADNGAVGRQAVAAMDRIDTTDEPIIVGGDFRNVRAGAGDSAKYVPAQPTFIRSGYYDALASQSKRGVNFNTVNEHHVQKADPTGAAWRADVILMKGIVGSQSFVNVANWFAGGGTPSDHNLIYSDIMIPTR